MKHSRLTTLFLIVAAVVAAFAGCGNSDRQVAEVARQAAHEQAAQNERITEANKTVAEGSKRLVEAEEEARRELIDREVSRHTGESLGTIRRRGFSIVTPPPRPYEPDADELPAPRCVDWDEVDRQRRRSA